MDSFSFDGSNTSYIQSLLWQVGDRVGLKVVERPSPELLLKGCLHDMRSPLSVMSLLRPQIEEMNGEVAQLLALALNQIEAVSTRLRAPAVANPKKEQKSFPAEELLIGISSLVRSKKIEFDGSANLLFKDKFTRNQSRLPGIDGEWLSIISNFLNNSVEGGAQNISVNAGISREATRLKITVADDGVGLDTEQIEKFNQGQFHSTKGDGRGFGLKKAFDYIHEFGGELVFVSQRGGGLKIIMIIPLM